MKLFKERALPDLVSNIKCGNSLIGPNFYCVGTEHVLSTNFVGKDHDLSIINQEEFYRINPFDWKKEFHEIMRGVELYKKYYASASKGNYDIYVVFVERGLHLLNKSGHLGFILPHKFFNAQYGEPLRSLLSKGKYVAQVVHLGHQQVFAGATNYTCLLFLNKAGSKKCHFIKVDDLIAWRNTGEATEGQIHSLKITSSEWNFTVGKEAELFEKLSKISVKLGDMADIFVGLQTSADNIFIMELLEETPKTLRLKSKALDREWIFEKGLLFPLVSGTDVNRYCVLPKRQYILFPYRVEGKVAELINFDIISKIYPKTADYLLQNKKRLEDREKGKLNYVSLVS